MITQLYDTILRTGLLPTEMENSIRSGNFPSISTLVTQLLVTVLDCHIINSGDTAASWTERRLSVLCVVTVLVVALGMAGNDGPGSSGAAAVAGFRT